MTRFVGFMVMLLLVLGCGVSGSGQTLVQPVTPAKPDEVERGIADFPLLSAERDWPWWRGPSRNGLADPTASVPTTWSEQSNVAWRAEIPGRGHSSPVVVDQRVFLATADEAAQVQSVVAFDRQTGRPLWKTDVNRGGFPSGIHRKNTHASPTIASDGQRLFVTFHNHQTVQATALDLDGTQLWQRAVGAFEPQRYEYGYGPSPTIYRNLLIIAAECDIDGYIVALDRETGRQMWRTERSRTITYTTPVVAHVAGRDQLLTSGADHVSSYDPNTSAMLWSTPGTTSATSCTVVWDGDIVFASGGFPKAETLAVRADGSGQVLWRNNQKCYEQSMLAYQGYVYALTDNGILFCWRGADGQEMWRERLRGPVSASPVLAGGHIYQANERGTMYVFKADPSACQLVAENQLGDEAFASPAIVGRQIFLRVADSRGGNRQEYLYCISQ